MTPALSTRLIRWTVAASVVTVFFVGFMGFMHTPSGRRLLAKAGVPCPLDKKLTPEQVDASRRTGVHALRGKRTAPRRPALGLELDGSTEAQAAQWAQGRGLACKSQVKGARFLKCSEPGSPSHQLTLAFDPAGRLVSVDVFRNKLTASDAARLSKKASRELHEQLGKPTDQVGQLTPEFLGTGEMKTAYVQYRFNNYIAMVTASYLPWSGAVLHEQYMSAR